jgi:hypothetical protein
VFVVSWCKDNGYRLADPPKDPNPSKYTARESSGHFPVMAEIELAKMNQTP